MTLASDAIATFEDVTYSYPGADRSALDRVNWRIPEGGFVLVAGPSGSGKSTLLRCLNGLVPHFSGGRFGGRVTVAGRDTRAVSPRDLAAVTGFVFQDPESQLVATRVDEELAFGLEQLGTPLATMRVRVEEALDLVGIADLRGRVISTLSGGERQRVAVAAVLAMRPRLLVLDEPSSQLDPWAAEALMEALVRLNDDLGLTVVLSEHRMERIAAHAERVRYLPSSGEAIEGPPAVVLGQSAIDDAMLPPVARLGRALGWTPVPLSVKDARATARRDGEQAIPAVEETAAEPWTHTEPMLELERVAPRVDPDADPVLSIRRLTIGTAEIVAVMGRNGSGKTTLLRAIAGFQDLGGGRMAVGGVEATELTAVERARRLGVGYVPQDPTGMLFAETLADEIAFTRRHQDGSRELPAPEQLLERFGLASLTGRHPRDLSGGERERAALAAMLAGGPRLLLLDEPTRGMDGLRKRDLATLLWELSADGVTILLATHDVELVASVATRVVLLGGGEVVADGTPRAVFAGGFAYSTQMNKVYGGELLTVDEVLARRRDTGAT